MIFLINNYSYWRKVSYAIQYKDPSKNIYSKIGNWSTPYTLTTKANPLLNIDVDTAKTTLIFRRFDNRKPELVGIVEKNGLRNITSESIQKIGKNQLYFKDIDRDLYNADWNLIKK